MADTLLKVDNINVYYGNIHAVKDISFEVNQGEIVTLIGANGAGKSTTLKTISGLLKPKTGDILYKGFGSENMSRIQMLKPADGVEGFKKFVLDTVKLAGSNPCPPIVLGIGVGGSFDKVAYLAKKALLRPLDAPNPDPYYAQLEQELLAAINELGIGPQGFGGRTTCLGLAIEQMPTHVAGLPAAVNVSCHVTRRASAEL